VRIREEHRNRKHCIKGKLRVKEWRRMLDGPGSDCAEAEVAAIHPQGSPFVRRWVSLLMLPYDAK